ncbi:hypothetical protein Dda_7506 [Drechslerella dactyloides]|uniref:Uncharacterized protein n=1 Tax=Drechslerella dactyloides TaxID=74499 RepID=A0AAD6IS99_DREDA|nr:hypothetical protein Dda_7506 [Drechslerella dactyloides]
MALEHDTTSFTWRGLHEFKESARKDIIEHYKRLQDYGTIMKVEFDPVGNTFTLTGPKDRAEEAQTTFISVVNTYIDKLYNKTLGRDLNANRGKITRALQTRMNLNPLVWTDDPQELKKGDQDEILEIFEAIDTEVETGRYEKFCKWIPTHKDRFRECFFPEKLDFVTEIAESVGCVMKVDWVSKEVNVGAPTDEAMSAGLEKLNLTEQYYNWPYHRLTSHLINNDGRERFEVRLVLITRQPTTIGKSTLFPPSDQYSSLTGREKLASTRLAEYKPESDKYENVTFNCNATYNAGRSVTDIWKDYEYVSHYAKIRPDIASQAERSTTSALLDKGKGLVPFGTRPGNAVGGSAPITLAVIKKDQVTGNLAFGSRPQEAVDEPEGEELDLPTLAPKRKVRSMNPKVAERAPPTPSTFTYRSPSPTESLSTVSLPSLPAGILASKRPSEGTGPKPLTIHDLARGKASANTAQDSDSGSSNSTSRPVGPPSTRRPRPKKENYHTRKEYDSDKESEDDGTFQSSSSRQRKPSYLRPAETNQEIFTRTFKHTQNQRAPHHKQKFDSFIAIQQHQSLAFQKVFETAFEDARRFRGDIKFEVRLGRIVCASVPKKYLKTTHAFQWSNWEDELRRIEIPTLFTNIISISPCDADFTVGLKIPGGDPLFENPPGVRNVSYEIEGLTFQKVPFTIIINAETFEFEIRAKEERFGTVLWNCPTVMWDAEFSLRGCKVIRSLEAQAQLLVESMEIEEGLIYPSFTVCTKGLGFDIVRGSCRRESRHMVLPSEVHHGHEFTLVITEHIDFKLQERDDLPDIIRFQSVEGIESFRQNLTWYSMHFVVDEIEQAFWKQRALRVAELGDTDAMDILLKRKKDDLTTLEALIQVVSNLISKINNVGYSNMQYTLHAA